MWRLDDHRALVLTIDVLTPVVDDARTWGRVAAANAVSDVHAMGARPLLALNYAAWPRDQLPLDDLAQVLAGGAEVAATDGFVIAGGHSVDATEPAYGLAVLGEVDPARMTTNDALVDGDVVVLTKPLGVGILTTAIKAGAAIDRQVEAVVASMSSTNRAAADAARRHGVAAATDVTGFGLLGHLGRMALESSVDVEVDVAGIPLLPGARDHASAGVVPGGAGRNLSWARDRLDAGGTDDVDVTVLADPQTSGGLLLGVGPDGAAALVDDLVSSGHVAAVIGRCASGTGRLLLR